MAILPLIIRSCLLAVARASVLSDSTFVPEDAGLDGSFTDFVRLWFGSTSLGVVIEAALIPLCVLVYCAITRTYVQKVETKKRKALLLDKTSRREASSAEDVREGRCQAKPPSMQPAGGPSLSRARARDSGSATGGGLRCADVKKEPLQQRAEHVSESLLDNLCAGDKGTGEQVAVMPSSWRREVSAEEEDGEPTEPFQQVYASSRSRRRGGAHKAKAAVAEAQRAARPSGLEAAMRASHARAGGGDVTQTPLMSFLDSFLSDGDVPGAKGTGRGGKGAGRMFSASQPDTASMGAATTDSSGRLISEEGSPAASFKPPPGLLPPLTPPPGLALPEFAMAAAPTPSALPASGYMQRRREAENRRHADAAQRSSLTNEDKGGENKAADSVENHMTAAEWLDGKAATCPGQASQEETDLSSEIQKDETSESCAGDTSNEDVRQADEHQQQLSTVEQQTAPVADALGIPSESGALAEPQTAATLKEELDLDVVQQLEHSGASRGRPNTVRAEVDLTAGSVRQRRKGNKSAKAAVIPPAATQQLPETVVADAEEGPAESSPCWADGPGPDVSPSRAASTACASKGACKTTAAHSEYTIRVDRSGGTPLGIKYDPSGGSTVLIQVVEEAGLIKKWNKANRKLAVKEGDRIVEVNGERRGSLAIVAECKQQKKLCMRLRRDATAAASAGATRGRGKKPQANGNSGEKHRHDPLMNFLEAYQNYWLRSSQGWQLPCSWSFMVFLFVLVDIIIFEKYMQGYVGSIGHSQVQPLTAHRQPPPQQPVLHVPSGRQAEEASPFIIDALRPAADLGLTGSATGKGGVSRGGHLKRAQRREEAPRRTKGKATEGDAATDDSRGFQERTAADEPSQSED
eukprot:TRINITY_DN121440_c0_g1_i1.p1 TRINITY_DN121440_c0_g1~~TRINITY_DN121440_c0_g1_i1.p1  ORF type:complete len:864 (-),score=236.70 TRINITY_DN121440_c0_g1_i1:178-2769(-)